MALKAPAGLKAEGRRLWRDVTGQFELSAAEQRLLEHACREQDLIARIDERLETEDLYGEGYKGQPVANPLLTEIRQHRATYSALMAKLNLPDDDEAAGQRERSRSSSARELANARWRRGA